MLNLHSRWCLQLSSTTSQPTTTLARDLALLHATPIALARFSKLRALGSLARIIRFVIPLWVNLREGVSALVMVFPCRYQAVCADIKVVALVAVEVVLKSRQAVSRSNACIGNLIRKIRVGTESRLVHRQGGMAWDTPSKKLPAANITAVQGWTHR